MIKSLVTVHLFPKISPKCSVANLIFVCLSVRARLRSVVVASNGRSKETVQIIDNYDLI